MAKERTGYKLPLFGYQDPLEFHEQPENHLGLWYPARVEVFKYVRDTLSGLVVFPPCDLERLPEDERERLYGDLLKFLGPSGDPTEDVTAIKELESYYFETQ